MKQKNTMNSIWNIDWFASIQPGRSYLILRNHGGKYWVLPETQLRMGMELYQPTTNKGKLIKWLYPMMHKFALLNAVLQIDMVSIHFSPLVKWVGEVCFHTTLLPAFYFLDSPIESNHKLTAQFSNGKKILGYGKFTDSPNVAEAFRREGDILAQLKIAGVDNVPTCLACGEENGVYYFAQTTQKTPGAKNITKFLPEHEAFLTELYKKTGVAMGFRHSYEYALLEALAGYLEADCEHDSTLLQKMLRKIEKKTEAVVTHLCCGHNDFTPWNTYWTEGNLQVFDFEYAQMNCVPYLDAFHYWLQPLILDQKRSPEEIMRNLTELKSLPLSDGMQLEEWFALYLLKIIAFHYRRNDGKFDWNDWCYKIWRQLLSKIDNVLVVFGE